MKHKWRQTCDHKHPNGPIYSISFCPFEPHQDVLVVAGGPLVSRFVFDPCEGLLAEHSRYKLASLPGKPDGEFYVCVWALLSDNTLLVAAAGLGRVIHLISGEDMSQVRILHGHGGSVVRPRNQVKCVKDCSK